MTCQTCYGNGKVTCSTCSGHGKVICHSCTGKGGFKNVMQVSSDSTLAYSFALAGSQLPKEAATIKRNLMRGMVGDALTEASTTHQFSSTPEPLKDYSAQVDQLLNTNRLAQGRRILNQRLELCRLPVTQFKIEVDNATYAGTCYGKQAALIIEDSFLKDVSQKYERTYKEAKANGKIGKALKWLDKTRSINPKFKAHQLTDVEQAISSSIQLAKVVGLIIGLGAYSYLNLFLLERYLAYPNWVNIITASQVILFIIFLAFLVLSLRFKPKIAPRFVKYYGPLRWGYFAVIQAVLYCITSLLIMVFFYIEELEVIMRLLGFLWE